MEPLGGELDWGERVLDLVRNAPRDIGPGGAALIEQLLGNILKAQDKAVALRYCFRGQRRGFGVCARELDDRLALVPNQQLRKFGRDVRQGATGQAISRLADQPLGGGVGELDAVVGVHRNHCRRHAAEHRFNKAAPSLELFVDANQRAGLPFQLFGHSIERAR